MQQASSHDISARCRPKQLRLLARPAPRGIDTFISTRATSSRGISELLYYSSSCLVPGELPAGAPRGKPTPGVHEASWHSRASSLLDITLTTQVSLDRWPALVAQALAWGGPVSVAVHIPAPPGHPLATLSLAQLQHLAAALAAQAGCTLNGTPSAGTGLTAGRAAEDAAAASLELGPEAPACARILEALAQREDASQGDPAVHMQRLPGAISPSRGASIGTGQAPAPRLLISALYAQHAPGVVGSDAAQGKQGQEDPELDEDRRYERAYPINALRNVALQAAQTALVLSLDADLVPSAGLRRTLLHELGPVRDAVCELAEAAAGGRSASMLVLPVFEATLQLPPPTLGVHELDVAAARLPTTLAELLACSDVRPFHCGKYPQRGPPSVDYNRWWDTAAAAISAASATASAALAPTPVQPVESGSSSAGHPPASRQPVPAALPPLRDSGVSAASGDGVTTTVSTAAAMAEAVQGAAPQTVQFGEYWEPLGVAARDTLPPYDERFRGYGLNKVQHALHMAALGFRFQVVPCHFLVTAPHPRSPSFKAAFGTSAEPSRAARVEALYQVFKDEMRSMHGYVPPC